MKSKSKFFLSLTRKIKKTKLIYIFPVLWMILIFYLSSFPGGNLPKMPFYGFDKIVHLIEYGVLGFFLCFLFKDKLHIAIITGAGYGFLDELHQLYVPYRNFSIGDWISDCLGVIVGIIFWLYVRQLVFKLELQNSRA